MIKPRCQECGSEKIQFPPQGKITDFPDSGKCLDCGTVSLEWVEGSRRIRARKRFELVVEMAGEYSWSYVNKENTRKIVYPGPDTVISRADAILTELYGEAPDA